MILRRAIRNVLSNYVLVGVSGLIGLILTPLLFHYLHPENFGVLAFALSLAALLESADMGMSSALIRSVSGLAANGSHEELRRLASSVFLVLAGVGVAMAVLVGLLSQFAAGFFHIRVSSGASGQFVIVLIGLSLLFQMPGVALRGYMQGCHDFHLANAVDISGHVLRAIATITLLELGYGLLAIATIFPLVAMLRLVGLMLMARHASIPFRPRMSDFSVASLKGVRTFAALCFVEDTGNSLFLQSDTFLVARLLSLPELAILVIARRFPRVISRLAQVTLAVAYPMMSSAAARQDQEAVRKFMVVSSRNTLAVTIALCTTLYVWAGTVLRIWIGPEVLSGTSVFRVFLVFAVFASLQETPLTLLYGMGRIGFSVGISLAMLLGVVLLAPMVCTKGGLLGLALALASVQALATMLFFWRALKVAVIPIVWWARKSFAAVIGSEVPSLISLVVTYRLLPHSVAGVCFSCAISLVLFLVTFALILTGIGPRPWRSRVKVLLTGTD
jgi:O-antigen/teichoic acid export membrane protein